MKWITPIVGFLCLAADIASKSWARANLKLGLATPFLPGIVRLTLTTNTGAAFGLGAGSGLFMTVLAFIILATVIFWVIKREKDAEPPTIYERVGMGFLLGGAVGNIWDRLIAGRVTDFIELSFINFPIFNWADVSIDIGAVLILLKLLGSSKSSEQDKFRTSQ